MFGLSPVYTKAVRYSGNTVGFKLSLDFILCCVLKAYFLLFQAHSITC